MKLRYWTLLWLMIGGQLIAEERAVSQMQPLFIHLRGIALVDRLQENISEKGITSHGVAIPEAAVLKSHLLSRFVEKGFFSNKLGEIEQAIKAHYEKRGMQWVVVMIPEQELASGVLQVVIVQGSLGKVVCLGNRWFSDKLLKSYIKTEPGEILQSSKILNDIAWMNRNPFRQTDVALKAGQDPKATDLQLITADRIPLRVYVGADNTGTFATGRARGFTGVTWGDVFGWDHRFTYQYTTDWEFHRFQAHTFQYLAPLSWRHQLFVYGGVSWVHPNISHFRSDGNGGQASLRYTVPFNPLYQSFLNELTFGFDFKRMNNALIFIDAQHDFGELPLHSHEVNLTQAMMGYAFAKQFPNHRLTFNAELYLSPFSWISDQSHRDYHSLRPKSTPHYVYGKAAYGEIIDLPEKTKIYFLMRLQVASMNLLPSEQFGLGGYDTVRGYQERQVNVDNALCANLEFQSPKWKVFGNWWKVPDEFMVLAFIDYGFGRNCQPLKGEHPTQNLVGIGPGIRYSIGPYFSLRLDYGFPLNKTQFQQQMKPQLHIGAIASY